MPHEFRGKKAKERFRKVQGRFRRRFRGGSEGGQGDAARFE